MSAERVKKPKYRRLQLTSALLSKADSRRVLHVALKAPITSNYRRSEMPMMLVGPIPRTKGRAMAQSAAIPQKACMPNQLKR
jgi:hypothetical protein